MNYLTIREVLEAHAQFGRLDRDKVKEAMGSNWPAHWNKFKCGEAIFSARESS